MLIELLVVVGMDASVSGRLAVGAARAYGSYEVLDLESTVTYDFDDEERNVFPRSSHQLFEPTAPSSQLTLSLQTFERCRGFVSVLVVRSSILPVIQGPCGSRRSVSRQSQAQAVFPLSLGSTKLSPVTPHRHRQCRPPFFSRISAHLSYLAIP